MAGRIRDSVAVPANQPEGIVLDPDGMVLGTAGFEVK